MSLFPAAWLFVPGNRPERFGKAAASGAGAIILDLEDAVAPDHKDAARTSAVEYLAARPDGPKVALRINPPCTVTGLSDLLMLATSHADYIIVPKSENPDELALIGRILADGGSPARIVALVETARGVARATDLAGAGPAMAALMFGAADYAGDLGRRVGAFRPDFARAAIVNAAAAGGIAALDSPWFDVVDTEGLAHECLASANLGFHAKAAIHPAQVAVIAEAFAPGQTDIDLARRYIEASVTGVGLVDGKMVDVAMLNWARRIVAILDAAE